MWLLYRKLKIQKLPSGFYGILHNKTASQDSTFWGHLALLSAACFLSGLPASSGWVQLCGLSGVGDGSVSEESKAVPSSLSDCDCWQARTCLGLCWYLPEGFVSLLWNLNETIISEGWPSFCAQIAPYVFCVFYEDRCGFPADGGWGDSEHRLPLHADCHDNCCPLFCNYW